ncbi:MAG: hypothetical protein ACREQM_02415 [Candidatus Dormibacteraceae bacterium]
MTTESDWRPLVDEVSIEDLPQMINRALAVLADLLLDANHVCTFTLDHGPLVADVITSANHLLPSGCRVSELKPIESWEALFTESLPSGDPFVPASITPWGENTPVRVLAERLTGWIVALLGRLWGEDATAFTSDVECDDLYEVYYIDLVVQMTDRVSLLHLGVSD